AELDKLRGVIDGAKDSKIAAAQPSILAAEENLHSMVVDLDSVVTKVQTAQAEAKIVSQYSELVNEAKAQFQKEQHHSRDAGQMEGTHCSINKPFNSRTGPWPFPAGKLTQDDLNSLIAHAHRRIDQLNRELAEQRVREQIHIKSALEQQKLEDKKALELAVSTALEHNREQMHLEQEKKVEETREVMEAEMQTQLRRRAAAHTDHLRDILNSTLMEKETEYLHLTQDQLDSFTLDMNAAYARLKGIEKAIDSHVIAEEEAPKAHQLWLSVEALNYTLRTAALNDPTERLEGAVQAIKESCAKNGFALALATALSSESLSRGVYSEASLHARFYVIRQLARRVALIDETRNSLYQLPCSLRRSRRPPPAKLSAEDLDTFKLLSYAAYSLEHGDLELAAKFINQLKGESRRVAQD
ncbi:unnamed protein product, partial [Coregonus sp. 'balchen']